MDFHSIPGPCGVNLGGSAAVFYVNDVYLFQRRVVEYDFRYNRKIVSTTGIAAAAAAAAAV
jgi:hypothetical protein